MLLGSPAPAGVSPHMHGSPPQHHMHPMAPAYLGPPAVMSPGAAALLASPDFGALHQGMQQAVVAAAMMQQQQIVAAAAGGYDLGFDMPMGMGMPLHGLPMYASPPPQQQHQQRYSPAPAARHSGGHRSGTPGGHGGGRMSRFAPADAVAATLAY